MKTEQERRDGSCVVVDGLDGPVAQEIRQIAVTVYRCVVVPEILLVIGAGVGK